MRYLTLLLLLFLKSSTTNAQMAWLNLDTGINDNLTGVVFLQSNGLTSGEHGLYYTTNGGSGASSWMRLQIADPELSVIYENTKFTHCYSSHSNTTNTGFVYACGQDLITTKAVIIKVSLPSMTCQLKYSGEVNTKLNKIEYSTNILKYVAVGNNGLMVSFTDSSISTISSGTTDDLTAIDYDTTSFFLLGSYGKIRRANLSGATLGNLIQADIPNTPVNDICTQFSVGENNLLSTSFISATPVTLRKTHYQGPLTMNCLYVESGAYILVGTNQGIYRASNTSNNFPTAALEWQPETSNYQINDFWKQNLNSNKYACGNNGIILRTSIYGGSTRPYVRITSTDGGCYPGSVTFSALTGTATSGIWYSNGQMIHSGLGNFTYSFPSIGTYTISLVVQNSDGIQNTDSISYSIVSPPDITKIVTLSDNLLCKQETIQVQVVNSEPNIIYSLKQEGVSSAIFGESQPSIGGILTFNATIDVTGNYYVYARSNLANCGKRFLGNFLITVEETKASFHSSLINAEVYEPVDFYENTVDSQNFEWQFGPNATVATSSIPNVQSSFTAQGQATTSLHAWSNNNCHDIVIENIPYIYEIPMAQDDCFLLTNNSTDPAWPGYYNPDISQMIPVSNGLLTCGTFYNEIFDSKYGITLNLQGKKGGYLAKHDRNGVLKWVVYNDNTVNINTNDNVIYSCAEDLNGDIYISGKGAGKFYDNAGHVTDLSLTPIPQSKKYFLIKLNSKGELIWYMQNYVFGFVKLAIDHENNVVALSDFVTNYVNPRLYFNGVLGQLIGQQTTPMDQEATNEIIKISPQGTVIWDAKVRLESANVRMLTDLGFDNDNNLYVSAAFDQYASIYPVGSNTPQVILGDGRYGGKIGIFKFTKNGSFLWKMRIRTGNLDNSSQDATGLSRMIVDDDGTFYISGSNFTGYNSLGSSNYVHIFENTNGTTTTTTNGPFFVSKINSSGVCQWVRAAGNTFFGNGIELLKSGSEIFVIGGFSNNNATTASGTFDSTNGNNYNLTLNPSDYFMAVYDEAGNLKRIITNGNNTNSLYFVSIGGFFKGTGNYFYLAKSVGNDMGDSGYSDFGNILPTLNGREGTILRFTESCGIVKYDSTLSNNDFSISLFDNISVVPNPTTGEFNIKLHSNFENIVMEVTDITGKVVAQQIFNNITEIKSDIRGQTGIYFVKLKANNQEKYFKLVKF